MKAKEKVIAKTENIKAEKPKKTETKKVTKSERPKKVETKTIKKVDVKNANNNKNALVKTETVKKGIYRVVYDKINRKWNIKRDNAERVIDSRNTKEEALERVKTLSENNDAGFVVYKKDGKFQKK